MHRCLDPPGALIFLLSFFPVLFLNSQSIEQLIVRYRGEIQDKDKVLDRVKSEMKSLTESIRAAEIECKTAKSHVQRAKHLLHQAEDEYKKEQEDVEKEDPGVDEARCVCMRVCVRSFFFPFLLLSLPLL